MPSLPPSPNKEELPLTPELKEALQKRNFVLAELLARRLQWPEAKLKELQKKALQQFIVEFRNPEGTAALAQEYQLTKEELKDLFRQLISASPGPKQFDPKSMRFLNLEEWVQEHFSSYR